MPPTGRGCQADIIAAVASFLFPFRGLELWGIPLALARTKSVWATAAKQALQRAHHFVRVPLGQRASPPSFRSASRYEPILAIRNVNGAELGYVLKRRHLGGSERARRERFHRAVRADGAHQTESKAEAVLPFALTRSLPEHDSHVALPTAPSNLSSPSSSNSLFSRGRPPACCFVR